MSATATKKKTKMVQFASKGRNLRLILLPRIDVDLPSGKTRRTQEGFTAEFSRAPFEKAPDESDGSFEWPEGEVFTDPISGEKVDVIAELREHALNGLQFTEIGNEPDRPTEQILLAEIATAMAAGDLDRVVEIYDEEQVGEARDSVMNAALAAAKAIEAQGD